MNRNENLGHHFNKRLESFAPQSLLLADLNENHNSTLVLKTLTKNPQNKKLEFNHETFVERKNYGRKPDNTRVSVYAQKPRLKMLFDNISRIVKKTTLLFCFH
jgi:hypothetical protein